MRKGMPFVIVPLLAIWTAGASDAQITSNPIPAPIEKKGLAVEIKDLVRLPDTRGLRAPDQDVAPAGWARVSFVKDLPDGRRFANDSRGFLYLLDANNRPSVYADVAAAFPYGVYNRLESGFIGFAFHPDFARNGLFYTVHSERGPGNPKTPDFIPIGYGLKDVTFHNVITEWHATNPAANTFEGTRREVFREAHVVANLTHPMGAVEFNPTAKPGDADYGLLYTSGSDHGFSNGGGPNASNPAQTQRLDSIMTAILRIDPRSPSVTHGQKGLGDYTIPMANKFAADGDPKTLGEIYAYGFRNAHRISWDMDDGTMFASDIGMDNIEEINIVRNGENYGWMKREGIFQNARPLGGALNELYPLPPEILDGRVKDGFTYPVAMYDHDEGRSVTDGFAYHGRIAALARQVRVRRHPEGTPLRLRPCRDEKGRRRHSADRGADRRGPALCARRERQARGCVAARADRQDHGRQAAARRSAHRPQPRRRAVHHLEAGRHDPDARSVTFRRRTAAPAIHEHDRQR